MISDGQDARKTTKWAHVENDMGIEHWVGVKEGLHDKVVINLRQANDQKKTSMQRFWCRDF